MRMTEKESWESQETTNSYADLGDVWYKPFHLTSTIVVRNEGATNDGKAKILGSVNGRNYVEVASEQTISPTEYHTFEVSGYWPWLKVQVTAAVTDSQTDMAAWAAAIAL